MKVKLLLGACLAALLLAGCAAPQAVQAPAPQQSRQCQGGYCFFVLHFVFSLYML